METDDSKKSEVISVQQPFFPRFAPLSAAEIFQRSAENAGRYKSPLTAIERMARKVRAGLEKANHRMLGEPLKTYLLQTPPEWQTVVSFLHIQGIIPEPRFTYPLIYTDAPPLINTTLSFNPNSNKTDGGTTKIIHCRGVSDVSFEEAASKAIGELLERHTFSHYRIRDFTRGSAKSMQKHAGGAKVMDIFSMAGFTDWQKKKFPEFNFDENSDFYWLRGRELTTDGPAWIPAQLIYLNYSTQKHNEPFLAQSTSNGAAGHFTREEATLAAIYEYVQRDGFLLYWLRGESPPQIDKNVITDKKVLKFISRLERYNFSVVLLNTRREIAIPSCVCVLIDNSGVGPRYSVGGGASLDINTAVRSSIFEALGVHQWLRDKDIFAIDPARYEPFAEKNIGQYERLRIWKSPLLFHDFESILLRGRVEPVSRIFTDIPAPFANKRQELKHVVSLFKKLGNDFEIYAYEASDGLLKIMGYHAVKVIIPALLPLYLKEPFAPLGAKRLGATRENINILPHPFP